MQEKARKEVLEALSGKDLDATIQYADLEMPYLSAFIKESLRFFPTVTSSARINQEDCKLGEHHIPKGTFMFLYTTYLNRDPEQFDHADEFLPERFLPNSKRHFFMLFSIILTHPILNILIIQIVILRT